MYEDPLLQCHGARLPWLNCGRMTKRKSHFICPDGSNRVKICGVCSVFSKTYILNKICGGKYIKPVAMLLGSVGPLVVPGIRPCTTMHPIENIVPISDHAAVGKEPFQQTTSLCLGPALHMLIILLPAAAPRSPTPNRDERTEVIAVRMAKTSLVVKTRNQSDLRISRGSAPAARRSIRKETWIRQAVVFENHCLFHQRKRPSLGRRSPVCGSPYSPRQSSYPLCRASRHGKQFALPSHSARLLLGDPGGVHPQ